MHMNMHQQKDVAGWMGIVVALRNSGDQKGEHWLGGLFAV